MSRGWRHLLVADETSGALNPPSIRFLRPWSVVLGVTNLLYLIQQLHIYILPCKDLLADICTETWWKGHVFAVDIM